MRCDFFGSTFGLACSPKAEVRNLMRGNQEKHHDTVNLVLKQLFVDDLLGFAEDSKEAEDLVRALPDIFAAAQMKMHKWMSNDPELRTFFE